MGLFVTKKHHNYSQGGNEMNYQASSFMNFTFWYGSYFGLPVRGGVC